MTVTVTHRSARSLIPAGIVVASLAALSVATVAGTLERPLLGLVGATTVLTVVGSRVSYVGWPRIIAALILIILFIPIRRYTLPAQLPFQLEPYRLFVLLIVVVWFASLLVDPRTRLRRTRLEVRCSCSSGRRSPRWP